MTQGENWHVGLTHLVPPVAGGRWISAVLLFGALMGGFTAAGVFGDDESGNHTGNQAAALFFAVIIAYIVPVFHFISLRTAEAIARLADDLDPDGPAPDALARRIYHKPRPWFAVVLGIGVGAALLHNVSLALDEPAPDVALRSLIWWAMVTGTTLVWVLMTLVIAALMDNAFLLSRVARGLRLYPMNPERVRPVGSVAVLSTLAIVGAQAAFPILIFDAEVSAIAFAPGLAATAIPMVILALVPIWPLQARLRHARIRLLTEVNGRIAALAPASTRQQVDSLLPLLAWRREVLAMPVWPVDARSLGRLAFYLILPPLTWVGAALIENVVEAYL